MSDKSLKDPFNQVTNPDGTPVRDKDNADSRPPPPRWSQTPQRNLAPPGMSGIRSGHKQATPRPVEPQKQSGIAINGDQTDKSLWIEGSIMTMPGYTFHAKLYDEPSKFGIEGGKISKLDVRKDDNLVMRYDRGWVVDPKTQEQKEALQRIRTGLDDTPKKPFKSFDHKPGQEQGIDR
ncbi:DUF7678 domain-containing protein [Roseobacter sp. GAI101]|uniref:DUF7678 domain-containing protein n=1 Tax=Roseobacter sp. (strain GAI101) TaxID=391589 RepID=UPI000682791C|nr:hypothetical protein [Roseobacter sp. GAI101]